jgi:hypothetical protein
MTKVIGWMKYYFDCWNYLNSKILYSLYSFTFSAKNLRERIKRNHMIDYNDKIDFKINLI